MKRFLKRLFVAAAALPVSGISAPGGADSLKPPEKKADVPKAEQVNAIERAPSDVDRIRLGAAPSRAEVLRSGFYALGTALKALISLPFALIGRLILHVFRRAFRLALSPVAAFLLEFLLWAALLFGLFALIWRLLFPERPLRDLFKNKRWLWILGAAFTLTLVSRMIRLRKRHRLLYELLLAAVLFGLMYLLFRRLFRSVPPPEQTEKWIELPRI